MIELMRFDRVVATFAPTRTDDLRPELVEKIGCVFTWRANWTIEEGPYEGQWAMSVDSQVHKDYPLQAYWVPCCDLAAVEREGEK